MVWLKYASAEAFAVTTQSDGKLLVGGYTGSKLTVVRMLPSGALDATFGTGGLVQIDVLAFNNAAYAVAVQPDGKILVAGDAHATGVPAPFVVIRLLANGALDATFGTGGIVQTTYPGRDAQARSIMVEATGKLVVTGYSEDRLNPTGSQNYEVARYESDGSLDATFGNGGKATIDVAGTGDSSGVGTLVSGSKVLVAGGTTRGASRVDLSVARLNADGTPDPGFADGGVFVSTFGAGIQRARSLALDSLGRIVVGGFYSPDFGVFRLSSAGALDPTFGDGGVVTTVFGGSQAQGAFVQEDGKLVAVGTTGVNADLALTRYSANGALDPSFGTGGKSVTLAAPNTHLGTNAGVLDACHVVLVGGWADYNAPPSQQLALGIARYRR